MRISETGPRRLISSAAAWRCILPPDAEPVDLDSPTLNGQRSARPAPDGDQTIGPSSGAPAARAGRSFGSRVAGLTAVRFISVAAGFLTSVVGARLLGTDGVGAAGIAVAMAT